MKEVEALVIGAGIAGSAAAYELARRGRSCLLVDRGDAPGAESTGAAAGLLSVQHEAPGTPMFDLCAAGYERWRSRLSSLEGESGVDLLLVPSPGLWMLADDAAVERASAVAALQRALGLESEILTPVAARANEPHLRTESACAVWRVGIDHHLSSPRAALAMSRAAQRAGAAVSFSTLVTAIVAHGPHRFVVDTSRGAIACSIVIDAAGAWAGQIAALLGIEAPVVPVRGQAFFFEARPKTLSSVILTEPVYLLQRPDGRILVGATVERVGFDKSVIDADIEALRAGAVVLVPSLGDARITDRWAGLRPGSADHLPILDAPASAPGFVIASGLYRHGILLGPLAGEIAASLALGEPPPVDVSAFSLGRFRQIAAQGRGAPAQPR